MAKTAHLEEFVFPEGGIGDFYMEDDEIEALGRLEAEEEFGSSGIANFSEIAERMASYGRHGDDTVAHVETGELIIPKVLIEDNPKLRDSIFEHLEELGVEDPERYVVGSGANSINPETGLPEFFFRRLRRALKKTVKKVSRAVKKVAKKVVKVVKKAAPIIIPLVLNAAFPGLGAIYSGAVGAGIGTLVQGGSLEDAFKAALVGGAIGGATAGISGGVAAQKAGGSFTQGAVSGIKNAAQLSNLTTAGQQLASGQFGQAGLDKVLADQAVSAPVTASEALVEARKIPGTDIIDQGQSVDLMAAQQGGLPGPEAGLQQASLSTTPTVDASPLQIGGGDPVALGGVDPAAGTYNQLAVSSPAGGVAPYEPKGFFENIAEGNYGEAFLPSGPTPEQITQIELNAYNNAIAGGASPALAETAAARAVANATPGLLTKFGPSAAVAGTAAYALGAFDKPEDPPMEDPRTGADEIRDNPDEYLLPDETPRRSTGPIVVATDYQFDPRAYGPYNPFRRPQFRTQRAAEGGEIFPRRVGGIMPDEGTPGEDSVRAMLMPGEFVMTTDAVKGLGNGDNEQGIRNMYDMMRGLEAKGRAMA